MVPLSDVSCTPQRRVNADYARGPRAGGPRRIRFRSFRIHSRLAHVCPSMCLRREEGCEAPFVRPREEVDPLKKEKSSMAVITHLADLPGLKGPAAGLKRAAVVYDMTGDQLVFFVITGQ